MTSKQITQTPRSTMHTPGPWEIHTLLSGSENAKGFRLWSPVNERGGKTWIADVSPVIYDEGDASEEGKANVRLIASAPELFEVCRAILRLGEGYGQMTHVIAAAEVAIRKASDPTLGARYVPKGNEEQRQSPGKPESVSSKISSISTPSEAEQTKENL